MYLAKIIVLFLAMSQLIVIYPPPPPSLLEDNLSGIVRAGCPRGKNTKDMRNGGKLADISAVSAYQPQPL